MIARTWGEPTPLWETSTYLAEPPLATETSMPGASSLSSVVSGLVRAQMGSSVPNSMQEDEVDRYVQELILKEAKQKDERYGNLGIQAYLPQYVIHILFTHEFGLKRPTLLPSPGLLGTLPKPTNDSCLRSSAGRTTITRRSSRLNLKRHMKHGRRERRLRDWRGSGELRRLLWQKRRGG